MAAEYCPAQDLTERLAQDRLLTEVDHLLVHRRGVRQFADGVTEDVELNLSTATLEMAMPYAVSTTIQRAGETTNVEGRKQRMFTWLGKCAVEVAQSGHKYHFSEAAHKRVDIEVAEARHSQDYLRAGYAQVFISPKMSAADATQDVAQKEHLGADDSVRVSFLETDRHGNLIGRRMESLLVRDIPLDAWAAMLTDPANVFGRGFALRDESSALPIMELFRELELPIAAVPDGPVAIVRAVQPYIHDERASESVARQLARYAQDQALYRAKAEQTAAEWLDFDIELAESLHAGVATYTPKRFIVSLQHQWGEKELGIIGSHVRPDGEFTMTRELAALLEKAKQNILAARAAIVTGNEKVIGQIDHSTAVEIYRRELEIMRMKANGLAASDIARAQSELERWVASQNVTIGGGCPGEVAGSFRNPGTGGAEDMPDANDKKEDWKWGPGNCIVRNCKSPKPTEVGPCSVCRHCQGEFDAGRDPTETHDNNAPALKRSTLDGLYRDIRRYIVQEASSRAKRVTAASRSGELAIAGNR